MGICKVRTEIETERNETKSNETTRNRSKRNETKFLIIRLFGNLKVIILFTGVVFPDYLIPKVMSDYLSIAFREKLMIAVAKHVIIISGNFL
jgi:hypothetical protein